jgi:hypothetical protein
MASLLFFACASGAKKEPENVFLTNSVQYRLLPPLELEKVLDGFQEFSAAYDGNEYVFQSYVKADQSALEIVFFNSMGADMANLLYDNHGVHFSSAYTGAVLKPEYILADFQLTFYKPDSLEKVMQEKKLDFIFIKNDTEELRSIQDNGTEIIRIEKHNDVIYVKNFLRNYSYTIKGDFR